MIDLEATIPGFKEARNRECLHRALAFAEVPWTVCGLPCLHLTPTHRVELQLAGNAFACGNTPLLGDVYQFLWRVNPAFRRKRDTFATWRAHRKVALTVRSLPINGGKRAIHEYLEAMLQDMPEGSGVETSANPPSRYVHWMAGESFFFMTKLGMTMESYRTTPYLILQQLHRAFRMEREDDPQFINASDRLVEKWVKSHTVRVPGHES